MSDPLPTSDRLDAYFAYVQAVSPPSMRAWIAKTEGEFCAAVEDGLHAAIVQIEAGARHYHAFDERTLSLLLAQLLAAAALPSVAEAFHNGHVDVTVKHPAGAPYTVLGECKIYRGYAHHRDGCGQVLKRYASGRSARAFSLDFFKIAAMYEKLAELRGEFDKQKPHDQIGSAANHAIKGAFVTKHKHFTSAVVELLHLGCNAFHPEASVPAPESASTTPQALTLIEHVYRPVCTGDPRTRTTAPRPRRR